MRVFLALIASLFIPFGASADPIEVSVMGSGAHFACDEYCFVIGGSFSRVLDQTAPNTRVVIPRGRDGLSYSVGVFKGVELGEDGVHKNYIFDKIVGATAEDLERMNLPVPKAGVEGGVAGAKPGLGLGKVGTTPGGGKGSAGSGNGVAANGTASGAASGKENSNGKSGSGSGVKGAIGNAASAAAAGAVQAGIVKGLVVTPSSERDLQKKQGAYDAAKDAAQAQEGQLSADLKASQGTLNGAVDGLIQDAKGFKAPSFPSPKGKGGAGGSPSPKGKGTAAGSFPNSAPGGVVSRVRNKMSGFNPGSERGRNLKDISLAAADASEQSFNEGEEKASADLATVSELFADVALAINPITSITKDGYEFFTGYSITGRKLSPLEQTLAGLGFTAGLLTMGVGSSVMDGIQVAGKAFVRYRHFADPILRDVQLAGSYAGSLGFRTAEGLTGFVEFSKRTLGNEIGAVGDISQLIAQKKLHLGGWSKAFDVRKVLTAEQANAEFLKRYPGYLPYAKPGTMAFDLALKEDMTFLRLHNGKNQMRPYFVQVAAIDRGLSPADLRLKYSLPSTPEFVTEAVIPKGAVLRRSRVGELFGGNEGAVQYEMIDPAELVNVKWGATRGL